MLSLGGSRSLTDRACLILLAVVFGGSVLIWFFWSSAKWWALGILVLLGLERVGEERICLWMFFISVTMEAIWLFCRFVFNFQL